MFGDVNIVIIFELSNPFSLFYYIIGTLAKLKLSKTPLTIYQCNDSIRLGRARKIKDPYAIQEKEYKEIVFNGTTREVIVDGKVKGTW